jgi:hypothetical protein
LPVTFVGSLPCGAVQKKRSVDPAGVGYGIFVYRLR